MYELNTRMPPNNREAEAAVLGGMLKDNSVIAEVASLVRPADFYVFGHQKIFEGMVALAMEQGVPVDLVTLANWLEAKQWLVDAGGHAGLVDLWDNGPAAPNVRYYCDIIRDLAELREAIHACSEIQQDAYDRVMAGDELVGRAQQTFFEIARRKYHRAAVRIDVAAEEAWRTWLELEERISSGEQYAMRGQPTGLVDLDMVLSGLQPSELIVLAARPSLGKTALALNVIANLCLVEKKAVFMASLEQRRAEIAERLLCLVGSIDSQNLRRGTLTPEELRRLHSARAEVNGMRMFIDDTPGQTMLQVAANARRYKATEDVKLVVVDYLQLIEADDRKTNREEQVASYSRRLKHLARELELPVVCLAQLNRKSEDRHDKRPRLSDLRESGAVEQDADTVVLLHRPAEDVRGHLVAIVAKQRNGKADVDVDLTFIGRYMRFENFAAPVPESEFAKY